MTQFMCQDWCPGVVGSWGFKAELSRSGITRLRPRQSVLAAFYGLKALLRGQASVEWDVRSVNDLVGLLPRFVCSILILDDPSTQIGSMR